MARPIKHNADYFSHDNNMRNDMKIKALRRKYKFTGYGVYIMMLELLTENDYFEIEWNEMSIELLTPDFDIDSQELSDIIDYCIKLNLLQLTNGYLHCDKLTARLEGDVLSRRKGYDSNNSKRMKLMLQQSNINPINVDINSIDDNISAQSKVKEIKVNESKEKEIKENESEVNQIQYTTGLLEKILDRILQYDNTKLHRDALEDLQDCGGINKVSEILNWDDSVKNNYIRAINQHIEIHNNK